METELLEQRIRETEEEIGRRSFDDPVREKLIEQVSIMRKTLVDAMKAETDRLNMNQQYDRLEIEHQKLEAEKKHRVWDRVWDLGKDICLYLASGVLMGVAFNFENLNDSLLSRTAQMAMGFISKLKRR